MKAILRKNGLSICFFVLFLLSLIGQFFTGLSEYNKDRLKNGQAAINAVAYSKSGHFIQATFENWESEFLQMALFIVLTVSLRQRGSSESKKCEGPEEVDREPSAARKGAPWPVRKGGWLLAVYRHSLSISLFLLFLVSFIFHLLGSLRDENEHLLTIGMPVLKIAVFLGEPRFWFESFQNWQSEFLSVFAIVVLSVFLRQQGSPQSKPVDAADAETGE